MPHCIATPHSTMRQQQSTPQNNATQKCSIKRHNSDSAHNNTTKHTTTNFASPTAAFINPSFLHVQVCINGYEMRGVWRWQGDGKR